MGEMWVKCGRTGVLRELGAADHPGIMDWLLHISLWALVPRSSLKSYSSTLIATSHSPPCLFGPPRWKVGGQLGSPAPWDSSHHKTGWASWKTKGGMGSHQVNVSLQSLLWPVQHRQTLPGCVLWASREWVLLWKPQPRLLHRHQPVGKRLRRNQEIATKCAVHSALQCLPLCMLQASFLPSIHQSTEIL